MLDIADLYARFSMDTIATCRRFNIDLMMKVSKIKKEFDVQHKAGPENEDVFVKK